MSSSDGDDVILMAKRAPASARKALDDARKLVRERRQETRDREAGAGAGAGAPSAAVPIGGVTEGSKGDIGGAIATKGDAAKVTSVVIQNLVA